MEAKKGCLGYLLAFLTVFVLTLVLAGAMKQVQAENTYSDEILYDDMWHWKKSKSREKEYHIYSGDTCEVCGNSKPDWYDESAHKVKDGVKYVSLKEVAAYLKKQLMNRETGFDYYYYIDDEKLLQAGENWNAILEKICQHNGVSSEGDILLDLNTGVGGEEYFFDGKTHYYKITDWKPWYPTTLEQEQELVDEIKRILAELKVDTLTDYEKIHAIYDYICQHVTYAHEVHGDEENRMVTSAYGALMKGRAVCDGYADLVYRMMLEAGIDTRVISNHAHAWNIVKLGDVYYCLDATWDAEQTEYYNFLLGLSEFRCVNDTDYHMDSNETHTDDFYAQYPVSPVAYGKTIPQTDKVIESGYFAGGQWTLTGTGVLTFSGSGSIPEWGGGWKEWQGFVKKIVIEEGITAIGNMSFAAHCSLEEVIIPESVTKIGDRAFCYCDRLSSITLPNKVNSLGKDVFRGCSKFTEVVIPDSVISLGEGAFRGCFLLENIVLSKNISALEKHTFYDCTGLRTLELPSALKEIGEGAFENCVNLGKIQFPDTLQKLGEDAFKNAFNWKEKASVVLPESVTEVSLTCFENAEINELVWNASAECIEPETFYECLFLENVVLGDAIKEIKQRAFVGCCSLKTLTLPENLEKAGPEAFARCKSLIEVTVPGSLKYITDAMFLHCDNLAVIELQEGTECIGKSAFERCSVEVLVLPASINRLDEFAFNGCDKLRKVIFEGEPPKASSSARPFNSMFDAYYWQDCGDWTQKAKNNLVSEGSAYWIARHSVDAEHVVSTEWRTNNFVHWHQCEGCELEYDKGEHVYDSKSDLICNVCDCFCMLDTPVGEVDWYYDEYTHWKGIVDQNFVDEGPHEFSYEQDPDCNVCGYIREVEHTHKNVFTYDEESHYMECETCGERSNVNPHAFKSDCSAKCNACKFTRESVSEHQYIVPAHNEKKHWMECACGLKAEQEEHIWLESKVGNVIMHQCEYCKAEKEDYESSENPSDFASTDNTFGGSNMIIIISAIAAVLLLGGIVIVVVVKKKHK